MVLRSTTKMAFQAAIAIGIAEFIAMRFSVDRGYWITVTAMALTTQTWGENVKRSIERVGMTILGGMLGTAFYFYLPQHGSMMLLTMVLVCIFFTLYFAKIHSLSSVFFLTCFVVFLCALLGEWNVGLLQARIIDTAIGAIVALVVGFCFFSLKTNISMLFIEYLQKIKATMSITFETKSQFETIVTGQSLFADFQHIKNMALSIRYELLFHRLTANDFNSLLNNLSFSTQHVIRLLEGYSWMASHLNKEEQSSITLAAKTISQNIDTIIARLQQKTETSGLLSLRLSECLEKAIQEAPSRFATLESDALGFFNLTYYFTRLNMCLNEIYYIVSKGY